MAESNAAGSVLKTTDDHEGDSNGRMYIYLSILGREGRRGFVV